MDITSIPPVGAHLEVKFDLDGEHIWWPATVQQVTTTGSRKRKTQKVYSTLWYSKITTKSSDYKEESGRVQFISSSELHVLQHDGEDTIEASWRFDFRVPNITDQRVNHYKTYNTRKTTNISEQDPNGRKDINVTEDVNDVNLLQSQDHDVKGADVVQRLTYLEQQVKELRQDSTLQFWSGRVACFKYSARKRLLDFMQRPFVANRSRQKTSFSNIFQHSTIRLKLDCDYELFTHLLRDIGQNQLLQGQVVLHPKRLNEKIPAASAGPLRLAFRSFSDLTTWLCITAEEDISRMLLRHSKTGTPTAVSILGSTVYNAQHIEERLEIFTGESSSTFGTIENDKNADASNSIPQRRKVFQLRTKEWDFVNNKFKHPFKVASVRPSISTTSSLQPESNNYFQVIWNSVPRSNRPIWSADSIFTSSTILGTVELVLPTAELYGRDAVSRITNALTPVNDV